MDRMRADYGHRTVFLMASDSPNWAKRYFGSFKDVFLLANYQRSRSGIEPAIFDFAVLSRCNHSIIR